MELFIGRESSVVRISSDETNKFIIRGIDPVPIPNSILAMKDSKVVDYTLKKNTIVNAYTNDEIIKGALLLEMNSLNNVKIVDKLGNKITVRCDKVIYDKDILIISSRDSFNKIEYQTSEVSWSPRYILDTRNQVITLVAYFQGRSLDIYFREITIISNTRNYSFRGGELAARKSLDAQPTAYFTYKIPGPHLETSRKIHENRVKLERFHLFDSNGQENLVIKFKAPFKMIAGPLYLFEENQMDNEYTVNDYIKNEDVEIRLDNNGLVKLDINKQFHREDMIKSIMDKFNLQGNAKDWTVYVETIDLNFRVTEKSQRIVFRHTAIGQKIISASKGMRVRDNHAELDITLDEDSEIGLTVRSIGPQN